MKLGIYLSIFILILGNLKIAFPEISAFEIAKKVDRRERGKDAEVFLEMILIDKKDKVRRRKLKIFRKDYEGKDKLLLKFLYPKDIKGTSFLVWEHKGRDNERFLYLPALGRIRRIATSQREENFAGSDFSYEDISGWKLEDYRYRLINEKELYQGRECFLLAYHSKDNDAKYPMIKVWIRKDNFVNVRSEYFNRRGELEKVFKVLDLKKIEGIWTPLKLLMENLKSKHKSIIKVEKIKYNQNIGDRLFTKREMKR
jgi:hypothetical protein